MSEFNSCGSAVKCHDCGRQMQEGETCVYDDDKLVIYCLDCGKFAREEYRYFRGLNILFFLLVLFLAIALSI